MAYVEKYYHIYCRGGEEYRLSIEEDNTAVELDRRGHFNDVAPSEIGIFKEGVDFSFLTIGSTLTVSGSANNNGTYTVTGFVNSTSGDPYIRIQLSPQVPVQIHEDVHISILPLIVAEEVDAHPVPFRKSRETSSELKIGGVYPTTATVTLQSTATFNLEELYTADERKYLVRHVNTSLSGVGDWVGNVIPNGFHEQMDDDNHYLVITASDNLATLRSLPFTDPETGENYGLSSGNFEQSFLWVLKEALKKTGLLLQVRTMVDVTPLVDAAGFVQESDLAAPDSGTLTFSFTSASDSAALVAKLQAGIKMNIVTGPLAGNQYTAVSWSTRSTFVFYYVDVVVSETIDAAPIGYDTAQVTFAMPANPGTLSDPLAQTVMDVRTFIRESNVEGTTYVEVAGGAMMTWDVLDKIALQWNMEVYQNNGRWEAVRINAHKRADAEYSYFIYNSEGTPIGRAPFGETILFPCLTYGEDIWRPYDHDIGMDRVLKQVRVNYRYKFKVEGDSLVNLIHNGNFAALSAPGAPPPDTNPAVFTPAEWARKISTLAGGSPFGNLLIQPIGSSVPGETYAPGIDTFIKIGGFYNDYRFLSSDTGYSTSVNSGDKLRISWWQRVTWWNPGIKAYRYSVMRIMVVGPTGEVYCLVNGGPTSYSTSGAPAQLTGPAEILSDWHKVENNIYPAFTSNAYWVNTPDPMAPWAETKISTPPCPINGRMVIEIAGAGAATAVSSEPFASLYTFRAYFPGASGMELRTWRLSNTELHLTGFFIGKIVDPSNEEIPQIHSYWYDNDRRYTDTINELEILTGDDDNPDHVSNIYVLTDSGKQAVKLWDSWANDFGWSALGLILAKSIMEQYWRPWRIIDGSFVAPNINWATRFEFEERPGERYKILRGDINHKDDIFTGTLVQIYDESAPVLPPGGVDGGGTIEPSWQPTGAVRCTKNDDGENTGYAQRLEVDMNPASPTFQQTRWVSIGQSLDICPLGEPIDIFWGEQATLNIPGLRYYPYEKNGDAYTVTYSNDGSNVYLHFLHRSALGTVQSIMYAGNYESISGWTYEADEVINGYTYKHLRLSWFTGVYSDLPVIFVIN